MQFFLVGSKYTMNNFFVGWGKSTIICMPLMDSGYAVVRIGLVGVAPARIQIQTPLDCLIWRFELPFFSYPFVL